jgi:hypothetical protein
MTAINEMYDDRQDNERVVLASFFNLADKKT